MVQPARLGGLLDGAQFLAQFKCLVDGDHLEATQKLLRLGAVLDSTCDAAVVAASLEARALLSGVVSPRSSSQLILTRKARLALRLPGQPTMCVVSPRCKYPTRWMGRFLGGP